jgi:hypothetical protein
VSPLTRFWLISVAIGFVAVVLIVAILALWMR